MLRQWLSLGGDNKDRLALIKPNNPGSDRQGGSDMPQRDTDNAIKDCPCLRYPSLYSSGWDSWINYVTGKSFAFYVMTVLTLRCSSLLSPSKVIRIPRQESERQGEWNRFTKLWWETPVMKEAFKVQKDSPFLFFCFRPHCYSKICQAHTHCWCHTGTLSYELKLVLDQISCTTLYFVLLSLTLFFYLSLTSCADCWQHAPSSRVIRRDEKVEVQENK